MLPVSTVPRAELIATRRRLHQQPELSMAEFGTARHVAESLGAMGLDEIRTGIGRTGVLGTLVGGVPGPVTLLRADMDALPVQELNEVAYRSRSDGVMHACGHDGHVAILLAAAGTLAARRAEVPGTLVFCFQPGEEGAAGNRLMIEDGALESPHVDRTFALHLYSGLEVGRIGVRDGPFFASADEFVLTVRGRGGHGAMPHLAVDPILAGAQLVGLLQTIVSREIAAREPVVVSVGAFTAGTTFNVIPDEAVLRGTVRAFEPEVRAGIPERMRRIATGLADALRVEIELDYRWSYPPTVNAVEPNGLVRRVAAGLLGEAAVVEHEVILWAEDMAFMQEQRPGAYFVVGSRGGEASAFPHHSPRFDIDERALEIGYRMMVGLGLSG